MTVEDKIDVLYYLFGICMIFWILRAAINLKRLLFPQVLERLNNKIDAWDNQGQYEQILAKADGYLSRYPGESNFAWAKARALFKLGRYDEARSLFVDISSSEPHWTESAEKYINNIDKRKSV
ncbi:M48 family metallopeptidase [Paraglaciecola sp. L3A3]|uniref:tetratricopeptide repeat protein n=1 Tax=Paraglaciecola sp. L3A3 TaxID=2686358 RepID=UPI00131DA8C6|nr:tetratricopeptide repeat protein [Paraglaciecola sp. L3A3]